MLTDFCCFIRPQKKKKTTIVLLASPKRQTASETVDESQCFQNFGSWCCSAHHFFSNASKITRKKEATYPKFQLFSDVKKKLSTFFNFLSFFQHCFKFRSGKLPTKRNHTKTGKKSQLAIIRHAFLQFLQNLFDFKFKRWDSSS